MSSKSQNLLDDRLFSFMDNSWIQQMALAQTEPTVVLRYVISKCRPHQAVLIPALRAGGRLLLLRWRGDGQAEASLGNPPIPAAR